MTGGRIIIVDPWNPDPGIMREAGALIRQGRLVAFPTETVYGLGANGMDPLAASKIFAAMYKHELTDSGIEAFLKDWKSTGQSIL